MNPQPVTTPQAHNPFAALALIALSILIILGWNLVLAWDQKTAGEQVALQQNRQFDEAAQTEAKLKAMMTDLLVLAKTDNDAATIVKHYKITLK